MAHTTQTLQNDLSLLGIDPSGALLVHQSYKAIGDVQGRGDAVLDALSRHMEPGLLLLPGHTWKNVNAQNPVMDVRSTPSCVGVLPELFRQRPGVIRSLHPTHSLCGLGRSAAAFLEGDHLNDSPCGFASPYRRLYDQRGQILLIGVRFDRNTFLHGVEEWYGLPGRLTRQQEELYVVDYEGNKLPTPQHRHCYPHEAMPFFCDEAMIACGAVTLGKFGDADCMVCDARKLSDKMGELFRFCGMSEGEVEGQGHERSF